MPLLTPAGAALGRTNALLCAKARQHSVRDFPGPLSIKHVVRGQVHWKTGRQELCVDESSFLILNDREPYSLHIDSPHDVETCCVFFQTGFVESIARCISVPDDSLLDDPFGSPSSLPFISRLHRSDGKLIPKLAALRKQAFAHPSPAETEDGFLALASHLLSLYEEMRRRISRLPAVRPATRLELLKRIERGREFLHAHPSHNISLAQTAAAACLSPYHFHRGFRRAFGTTPHAYLSSLRLDRAMRLLGRGTPVTEVCFAVGFESLGSFSTLFRKQFGHSPREVRKIR